MPTLKRDPWQALSAHTAARIALGRAGGSVRSDTLLEFRLAHARARDAVKLPLDTEALFGQLRAAGIPSFALATQATDRDTFLLRPDLGRALSLDSRETLAREAERHGPADLVIVVSDGLSALAAERQAVPFLQALLPLLRARSLRVFPVLVVPYARVKVADEIGERLGVRQSLILLGERPGLSSPDSLGAYLTHDPGRDRTDADRNCISNIRPEGLPLELAARKLAALLAASLRLGVSGVALKEVEGEPLLAPADSEA